MKDYEYDAAVIEAAQAYVHARNGQTPGITPGDLDQTWHAIAAAVYAYDGGTT
jgi:hypothetical protein